MLQHKTPVSYKQHSKRLSSEATVNSKIFQIQIITKNVVESLVSRMISSQFLPQDTS